MRYPEDRRHNADGSRDHLAPLLGALADGT